MLGTFIIGAFTWEMFGEFRFLTTGWKVSSCRNPISVSMIAAFSDDTDTPSAGSDLGIKEIESFFVRVSPQREPGWL